MPTDTSAVKSTVPSVTIAAPPPKLPPDSFQNPMCAVAKTVVVTPVSILKPIEVDMLVPCSM